MISIQELIKLKTDKFDKSKVKLVRHKDTRYEYRDVIKDRKALLEYQKEQETEIFKDTEYIISFIGQENSKALLFGMFKVGKVTKKNGKFYYDLEEIFSDNNLNDRIIIDWGKAAISWHQWYHKNTKEVIEILPKGYLGEFPGITNFVLDYEELGRLIKNPDANRDWKNHLSSICGIYMILDTNTGNQYIGAAYGNEGIWQRWTEYSKTKHGGNNKLMKLCQSDSDYHQKFQYTVLQSLPSNISQKEVIKIENLYKIKFGTKAHGLNEN
jgi:hypothetical protein